MKTKLVSVLFLVTCCFLNSCNDGDLIVESFNFDNAIVQKCTNSTILYKINANEGLIFNTPQSTFPNVVQTKFYDIGSSTTLQYKRFNSTVTSYDICGTPTVLETENWSVSGGKVKVVTTQVLASDNITVLAYNHAISFENVTFVTNGKQVAYTTYNFGNYKADLVNLNFDFVTATTQKCISNTLIFKYNGTKVLLLDVDPNLFANAITPTGSPRTAIINSTTNKIIYREYSGNLSNAFFCSAITPSTPTLSTEWIAEDGDLNIKGIIKVDTEATATPNLFKHTIKLFKVNFKNGVQEYSPAPNGDYLFGEYLTSI